MSFPGSLLLSQGDMYVQTADKRYPLGTRGYTRDGRVFRYAKAGATNLAVGLVMQAEAPTAWSDDITLSTAFAANSTKVVAYMTTASTALSASSLNFFDDGYMFVNDGTGEGQMVQIKRAGQWTSATTLVCRSTVVFQDGAFLTAPVTSGSEIGFIKNKYDDVIVAPAVPTSVAVGVTPMAVTATYCFWLQTWGPAAVMMRVGGTDTPAVGYPVRVDTTNDGNVSRQGGELSTKKSSAAWAGDVRVAIIATLQESVGTVMEVGGTGESGIVDLKLAP